MWWMLLVGIALVLWVCWWVWGEINYAHARGESAGYAQALKDKESRKVAHADGRVTRGSAEAVVAFMEGK